MGFLLLDPNLHPRAAGSYPIQSDEFARKLGRAAFIVWQALCVRRDATCTTYAKRETITNAKGFEHLPDSVVKDALQRLRRAGLVVDRWKKRQRALLPSGEMGWVYPRKVFGAWAFAGYSTKCVILVPEATFLWLQGASGWGGARFGARRKATPKAPRSLNGWGGKRAGAGRKPALPANQDRVQVPPHLPLRANQVGGSSPPTYIVSHDHDGDDHDFIVQNSQDFAFASRTLYPDSAACAALLGGTLLFCQVGR